MEITTKTINDTLSNYTAADFDSVLFVIYGSRTGNSKAAAILAWEYANFLGMKAELLDMKTFRLDTFKRMKNILIAVSTHGEGDPPAVAEDFYHFIFSRQTPYLNNVKFSILALGDSSYSDYCKTGKDIRSRMLELRASEISPLVECDIDYEENAKKWVREAISAFDKVVPKIKTREDKEFAFELNRRELSQENVFYAKVLEKKLLSIDNIKKKVFHLSLSIGNFGTSFFPGDTFGIFASNPKILVDKLLSELKYDGTHSVFRKKSTPRLLKEVLVNDYEITIVTLVVLKKYAKISKNKDLNRLLLSDEQIVSFCDNNDVLDMIKTFPAKISPEEFLSCLRKLSPRRYSVASSSLVFSDELHFTVGIIDYNLNGRQHKGVCSAFLDERTEVGDSIPVFYEINEKFRLPKNGTIPIIMIATGTGIAPFRAFLQEREYKEAKGMNWLFFGYRSLSDDYLYKRELNYYVESGLLTRFDLALSGNLNDKQYVQHILLEKGSEFYEWVDTRNAVVYLCGNKRTIGKDVVNTIKEIVFHEGKMTKREADEYVAEMVKSKRLISDLY